MELIKTKLEGVVIIQPGKFSDVRGEFVKTIHEQTFASFGLSSTFKESFYSVSKKNVIRGMHFQIPDEDHDKLVYTVKGKIVDVVLDLRKQSPTFGQYIAEELSEENRRSIYIPKGLAHGFLSLEEDTIVEYHTTTAQSRDHERGIRWDSFGYDWGVQNPVMSDRDQAFVPFNAYESPF